MFKFFHQLFNPHCQHCADERREQRELLRQEREDSRYCSSCETLARENARLVRENERLLEHIWSAPKLAEEKQVNIGELKPIQTTRNPFVPSAVRRQILENESRHNAQVAKNAPKPDALINKDVELQELSEELDNVRKERETTTKVSWYIRSINIMETGYIW